MQIPKTLRNIGFQNWTREPSKGQATHIELHVEHVANSTSVAFHMSYFRRKYFTAQRICNIRRKKLGLSKASTRL